MDAAKRKALVANGWAIGDAADFLEMSDGERQLLDARVQLASAIRAQRMDAKLSQKELGLILKTSQPRIAKIERASPDVSLDQLVKAFAAAGGRIVVKSARPTTKRRTAGKAVAKKTLVIETARSK